MDKAFDQMVEAAAKRRFASIVEPLEALPEVCDICQGISTVVRDRAQ